MFHIITRAYEGVFGQSRTLISNWIDRCFCQHLWNSVHSQETIHGFQPNPLSGSQQPPQLWGQWIRTKPCSKLTRPLRPCLIQTEVTFSSIVHEEFFLLTVYFGASYTTTFCDPIYTCLFVTNIWALFVRIYMRVWEENGDILGKKTRKVGKIASIRCQKTHVYRVIILKQIADHKWGFDTLMSSINPKQNKPKGFCWFVLGAISP